MRGSAIAKLYKKDTHCPCSRPSRICFVPAMRTPLYYYHMLVVVLVIVKARLQSLEAISQLPIGDINQWDNALNI